MWNDFDVVRPPKPVQLRAYSRAVEILYRSHGHHRLDRRGAACRGEAGEDCVEYCDRGADGVGQGLHVTQRDAHVFAVEANKGGRRKLPLSVRPETSIFLEVLRGTYHIPITVPISLTVRGGVGLRFASPIAEATAPKTGSQRPSRPSPSSALFRYRNRLLRSRSRLRFNLCL
jgi:hypothetical protein